MPVRRLAHSRIFARGIRRRSTNDRVYWPRRVSRPASDVKGRAEPHYHASRGVAPGQRRGEGGAGHARLSRAASHCRPLHATGTARPHVEDDRTRQRDVRAAVRHGADDVAESRALLRRRRARDAAHPRGLRPRARREEAPRPSSDDLTDRRRRRCRANAKKISSRSTKRCRGSKPVDPRASRVVELRYFTGLASAKRPRRSASRWRR